MDVQTVLDLYRCTAADVIETIRQKIRQIKICYYPAEASRLVKNWLGNTFDYEPQNGSHLGDRMKNAFVSCFKGGCSQAILVGTDLPGLSESVIAESFEKLDAQTAVLGPTYDGGYYLIGFSKDSFIPGVFDNIPWGTPNVFENTLERFKQTSCRVHILPKCRDIDTYDDLVEFGKCYNPLEHNARHTITFLRSLKLV
jgi:rSAM/selenodomain-associated transferase 1